MLKVPDVGELLLMAFLRDKLNSPGVYLHLYQNDRTPANADVLADYTDATFDGYVELPLDAFSVPITVSGRAFIAMGLQVFTMTGAVTPNNIYGYYVVNNAQTGLLWAERFSSVPIVMNGPGDVVSVTPSLTLRSEA